MTAESGYSVRNPGEVPGLVSIAQHDSGVRDRGPKRIERRRRRNRREQPDDEEASEPVAPEGEARPGDEPETAEPSPDDTEAPGEHGTAENDDEEHPKVDIYA